MAAADPGNIINRKLQKPKDKLLAALWQDKDNANEVSTLLEQNPELIGVSYNHMKEDGYTPLHLAVLWNRPAIVKILLDKGAEVNRQTARFHYTPLAFTTLQCYAHGKNLSLECRLEMAKGLIEKGALQSYVGDAQSNRAIQLIHSTYDRHYDDYRFDFDFLELVLQDKWMREAIYAPSKSYSDSASFLFKIFEAYISYFRCKDTESMARVEKILLLAEVNLRQLDQAKAPTNIKAFRNCFEKRDRQRQPEVLWQEWNKCEYLEKENGINSPQKREREVGYSSFFAWLPRETADAVIELVLPQQKR